MATINAEHTLRDSQDGNPVTVPGPDGPVPVTVELGDEVAVTDAQKSWTKVKLLDNGIEGWVPTANVDFTDLSPSGPIEQAEFARECWLQAISFGANAHYLVAIAQLRSSIDAGRQGDAIGPYRLTASEWNTGVQAGEADFDLAFASSRIDRWRIQCVVFAAMTRRAQQSFGDVNAGAAPSAIQLLKQWLQQVGEPVPADDTELTDQLQKAIDATREVVKTAGLNLVGDQAEIKPLDKPQSAAVPAGAQPIAGVNLAGIAGERLRMAQLILSKFAAAGYGLTQQIAALANAIRESNLIEGRKAGGSEDSWGLFQINRAKHALGFGHPVSELVNGESNIAIILAETAKHPAFKNAKSLREAVTAFVRDVERPADQATAIALRLQTANVLAKA